MEKVTSISATQTGLPVVGDNSPRPKLEVDAVTATSLPPVGKTNGKTLPSGNEANQPRATVVDPDELAAALESVNEYAQTQQRNLRFSVDQELGQAVVSVVDTDSDVVVRQIPSEVVIRLARNLEDYSEYTKNAQISQVAQVGSPAERLVGVGSIGETGGTRSNNRYHHLV